MVIIKWNTDRFIKKCKELYPYDERLQIVGQSIYINIQKYIKKICDANTEIKEYSYNQSFIENNIQTSFEVNEIKEQNSSMIHYISGVDLDENELIIPVIYFSFSFAHTNSYPTNFDSLINIIKPI